METMTESTTISYDFLKSAIVDKNIEKVQELLADKHLAKDDGNNEDLLTAALEVGNLDIIKLLLEHGCTATTSSTADISHHPLHHAIQSENVELVQMLIAAGSSIIEKGLNCKETPLQKAFELALPSKNFTVVDLMLSTYNVDSIINVKNEDEIIHFYITCSRNKVSLAKNFIDKGIDINIYLDHEVSLWNGSTALHYAVKFQALDTIELLLDKNPDLLLQDSNMQSPLHLAFLHYMNICDNEHDKDKAEEIIDLLLAAQEDDIYNPTDMEYGLSHFHIACMRNNISVIDDYLQKGVDVNAPVNCIDNVTVNWAQNTPLHFAAISCHKDIIKLLIENGANVNITNKQGLTPLWLLFKNQPKYNKVKNFIRYCVSKKKKKNENVKVEDECPLISLVLDEFEYIDCINLLVEAGSNVNHKDACGKPLLFELYNSTADNFINRQDILGVNSTDDISRICSEYFLITLEKTFDILKRKGIDFESRDANSNSIFHCIAYSVKTDQVVPLAKTAVELMLDYGVSPNVENANGENPISIATSLGSLEFVGLFTKLNVNDKNNDELLATPMDLTFSNKYENDVQRSKKIEILIENGANINERNVKGETILFQAARSSCYLSSMESILETANVDAQDNEGQTALFAAVLNNNHQATKLLLDYGANINIKDCNQKSLLEKLFSCNQHTDYVKKTYQPTLEVLEMHIRKLSHVGFFISHSNLVNYKRLKFAYMYEPHEVLVSGLFQDEKDLDIDVSDKDRQLTCELKEEIKKMKVIKVDDHTSLFDIVFKNPEKIAKHLDNHYFQMCMSEKILCSEFRHFGDWMASKFKEGVQRCKMMDDAVKSLNNLTGKKLPDWYIYDLAFYLSNRDLKNLLCVSL